MPLHPLPASRRSRPCRGLGFVLAAAACLASATTWALAAETAADAATRQLLEGLEERRMPDVVLWVLDRLVTDPQASADLKAEEPLRRALALAALGRTEADATKRAARFTEARAQLDAFLAANPRGRRAIDAYTQKGTLLIEQARVRLDQARRPGADVAGLRTEAVAFFDQALKVLAGRGKRDQPITQVDNAEDAIVDEVRKSKERISALAPPDDEPGAEKDRKPPRKPLRLKPEQQKELERLEAEHEALRARLLQTRLTIASTHFEKSAGFEPGSKPWTAAIEESTRQFKEIADNNPKSFGGVLARYYEGRNLAALDKRRPALDVLAPLVAIDDTSPQGVMLRARALATSLECWLADKKYDAFDVPMREFAIDDRKLLRLIPEADRLALKYRAALLLKEQAASVAPQEAAKGKAMLADAARLALEVAKTNRDFAAEARQLVAALGKDVRGGATQDFESLVTEAKVALATMQAKQAEAKTLIAAGQDAAPATAAAATARDAALAGFEAALAKAESPEKGAEAPPEELVTYARAMRAYLLYDAKRYAEAGDLGAMLVERYPNGMGSRQAGMVALAAFQQLAKDPDAATAAAAKPKLQALARTVAALWPAEKEGADALGILAALAIEARDPEAIVAFADSLPADAAGRTLLLARAGTALWREVLERGRAEPAGEAGGRAAGWKDKATTYLDAALAEPAGPGPGLRVTAAAALARAQIALDDGDTAKALAILEKPECGPWTIISDPQADPALRTGSFAEQSLVVALRTFVQAEQIDKAQQAMRLLEGLAGPDESEARSARLTAMYLSMARGLQEQLERLGAAGPADAAARAKAVSILAGFEKFLDGLAKRDTGVASRIWVATTYLTLGSGTGTGAIVPKAKAEQYLDRAADVFTTLLDNAGDPELARFEPSIRLKLASIARARGRWDAAREQIDWILSDAKRQNSLDTQVQAAELLQAAARALSDTDPAAAESAYREAATGRTGGPVVVWGWGGIAAKVGRQAFAGDDEKAVRARDVFFTARLNLAACLLGRAQLSGTEPQQAADLLAKAESAVALTRKMYPDLGGPALQARYEKLLKEIQKQQGAPPRGFQALDEPATSPAVAK